MARFFPLRNALTRKVRTSLTPETRNEEDLQDEPPSHAEEVLSNAQVITWSCVLTWEAAFITLGNLFTIITLHLSRSFGRRKVYILL